MGEVDIKALDNISFEIEKGEFVVVLGASGAGKTTILNILGGMDTATMGEIIIDGEDIAGYSEKQLTDYRRFDIGFVFQFYNLLPGLTALENIELAGEMGNSPMDARELIKEVGLESRSEHYPNRLSGGEQQRIAIARALCKNPDLLLCDEPTGALDSKTGVQVLLLIHDFCRRYEKPVVIITHNANIAKIADRVFHFKDGTLESVDINPNPLDPGDIEW